MKTFTAQVRVADQLYGNGIGRSKKEAEQAAAETAYGDDRRPASASPTRSTRPCEAAEDGRRRPPRPAPRTSRPCPSCPRSRWSAPAWPGTSLGATITSVEVLHPRPVRRDPRGPAGFAAALTGRRIEDARRRGKYLWLPLDNGDALLGHLGMSGQLLVQPPDSEPERHLRVRLALGRRRRGPRAALRRPADVRRAVGLGRRRRAAAGDRAHRPRPARPGVRRRRVRRQGPAPARSGIKRQLLDQNLISGVGNIYADEALWRARLHGERAGEKLTAAQVRELLGHARDVMNEALGQGGTSFDALYVNVNGESGYFDRVAARLRARGRALRPVRRADAAGRRS